MGKYSIDRSLSGQYHFTLFTDDGEMLLISQDLPSPDAVCDALELCRARSRSPINYTRHASPDGRYFFTLTGKGRTVLAVSTLFASKADRDAGIGICQNEGGEAAIDAGCNDA